jgi:hypothetical protein
MFFLDLQQNLETSKGGRWHEEGEKEGEREVHILL